MKLKGAKIIAVISIALVGLVGAAAVRIHKKGSLFGNCDRGVQSQVLSPDHNWTAYQINEICDIAIGSPASSMVAIGRNDDEREVVFEIDGANIDMTWKDSRHLVIGYPSVANVFTKDDSFDDISIEYVSEKVPDTAVGPKEHKLITSILADKISTANKVVAVMVKIGRQHGFTDEENRVFPEYRQSYESRHEFITDLKSASGIFLQIENISDPKCIIVRAYSNTAEIGDISALRQAIDGAVAHELGKGVKVDSNSVCGSAGEDIY